MLAYTPSGTGTNRRKYTISLWFKRSFDASDSNERALFFAGPYGNDDGLTLKNAGNLNFWMNGTIAANLITSRTFEDSTKFYHILVAVDTTQSTASDRVKLYVDGDQITAFGTENYPTQNYDGNVSTAVQHNVGAQTGNNRQCDGYLAEVNYVDGTALTPSTFGLTDTSTGRWIPKTLTGITYGTNGFRLEFANSAGQTIGDDTSGQGNDLTVTNITTSDISTDSPTQNFTTLDTGISGSMTVTEGNLRYTTASSSNWESVYSDKSVNTGKWYFEVTCKVTTAYDAQPGVILESVLETNKNQLMGYSDGSIGYNMDNAQNTLYYGNSGNDYLVHSATDASTAGVVIGVAYDADIGAVWFAKNNTWVNNGTGAGDPSAGTNATFVEPQFAKQNVRFGFSTYNSSASYEINFGAKDFNYTPPTDFKKIQQDNFSSATNDFADFVWTKNRDSTSYNHVLYDSNRGIHKYINSNTQNAEGTDSDGLTKFLNGGFATEDAGYTNNAGNGYVSWIWHANGGTTAANTDGSGATLASTTQANDTAGFSIVTYSGSSSGSKTVAHGLSSAPQFMIIKNRTDGSRSPFVYHHNLGNNYFMRLDNNNARSTGDVFNNTTPTSSVFSIQDAGSLNTNGSGKEYIAYCWYEVPGYSKFGLYTGGGGTDGTFTYTGFRPAWLLMKRYNSSGNWYLLDTARGPFNDSDGAGKTLMPNHVNADQVQTRVDILSNGFKQRISNDGSNVNSALYAYFAFAENPFVGDGTNPVTAR
jgi:hypothetical protein